MNPTLKRHLISAAQTFVATFLLTLGAEIQAGVPLSFGWDTIMSLVAVAVRMAIKSATESALGITGDVK